MKKILSLLLVGVMIVSMVPTVFATTDYSNGTQVSYNAEADNDGDGQPDHAEAWTVTVPAELAPGESGDVTASGTWASDRRLVVSADKDVTLTNSINNADQKVLTVTFPGIALEGSNTASVTDTKVVSVADISNALFGTWSGVFEYTVELASLNQFVFSTMPTSMGRAQNPSSQVEAELITCYAYDGMTWGEWVNSDFNTIGAYSKNGTIYINCPCTTDAASASAHEAPLNGPLVVNENIVNGCTFKDASLMVLGTDRIHCPAY